MSKQFPFDREIPCNNRWKDLPICGRPASYIIFKENTEEVIKARCEMCSNDERFKVLEDRVKYLENHIWGKAEWGEPENVRWIDERNITIVYHKDE